MGENGCGKTTLAKHMNGLILPTSGDVFVESTNTKNLDDYSKVAKIVSMTFQNPDEQIITSVVEDEIAFNLENICYPREKMSCKIEEMLEFVELEGYEKRATGSLSGGQKQKLMLACALSVEPKVIVLDEITSMLDPIARRSIMRILSKINRALKTAVVIITHDTYEAALTKRIILMKNGEIGADDNSKSILSDFEIMKKFNIAPLESTAIIKKLIDSGYELNLQNSFDTESCAKEIINLLEKYDTKNKLKTRKNYE